MPRPKSSRLVYSTENPEAATPSPSSGKGKKSNARQGATGPPADGVVRVWRQTKGRKGKGVTVITGLGLGPAELTKLAKDLKTACGSGGTAKAGTVEIQGDHRDRVIDELRRRGFQVKKAGG